MNLFPVARTIASYVLPKKVMKRPGSGGSFSSEYCYSVWLRHYKILEQNNLLYDFQKIAEIGPGDSLGVGIVGLLCGAKEYHALDVIEHANLERNIKVANEVAERLIKHTDIPNGESTKNTHPKLSDYSFPKSLNYLNEEIINKRLEQVIKALKREPSELKITYRVPWYENQSNIDDIDFIFSQAVMEHVDDIEGAYSSMYKYLKKGGIMSHQIDYKSHEMSNSWDGHWYISKPMWKFLLKGRKYSMNRLPHSAHIDALRKANFSIGFEIPVKKDRNYAISPQTGYVFLAEDLNISGGLIQSKK
jgi:SAM-dependent methyltransferase